MSIGNIFVKNHNKAQDKSQHVYIEKKIKNFPPKKIFLFSFIFFVCLIRFVVCFFRFLRTKMEVCPRCHVLRYSGSLVHGDTINDPLICIKCWDDSHVEAKEKTPLPSMESQKKNNERVCQVCWEVLGERFDVCCVHCRHVIDTINKNRNTLGILVSLSTLK